VSGYETAIRKLETKDGPYSPGIPQQAEALGDLYLKLGDPANAARAYEKSLHVLRTNQGLYTTEQQGLLRKLIDAQLAMNDLQRAQELHESLYHLQQKLFGPGDTNYIAAQLEWADWNVDRLLLDESISAGRQGVELTQHLMAAQDSYINVIEQIQQASADKTDPRLVHAEKKLAALNYIANAKTRFSVTSQPLSNQVQSENPAIYIQQGSRDEMAFFFNGSNALKRAIAYSLESPSPDYLSIAEQMMDLGDWYLMFERRTAALEIYADAFEVLVAINASEEDFATVMSPGMPVDIPDSSRKARLLANNEFEGYIDIEFQLGKFGDARSAEIIGASNEDASPVSKALLRKIRQEKFRPAFINGTATSHENVKLRYYYSYN